MAFNTDKYDSRMLELVNRERAKVGADPLRINQQLDQAADLHSQDQANMNNMTHTGSNGSGLGDRVDDTGYEWSRVAENVSQVVYSPWNAMYGGTVGNINMQGLMSSDGHRANILDPDVEEMGVGLAYSSDGNPYWTQVFAADFG